MQKHYSSFSRLCGCSGSSWCDQEEDMMTERVALSRDGCQFGSLLYLFFQIGRSLSEWYSHIRLCSLRMDARMAQIDENQVMVFPTAYDAPRTAGQEGLSTT